jgi:hypothetical protein
MRLGRGWLGRPPPRAATTRGLKSSRRAVAGFYSDSNTRMTLDGRKDPQ